MQRYECGRKVTQLDLKTNVWTSVADTCDCSTRPSRNAAAACFKWASHNSTTVIGNDMYMIVEQVRPRTRLHY
jgi:hypothetical protein